MPEKGYAALPGPRPVRMVAGLTIIDQKPLRA